MIILIKSINGETIQLQVTKNDKVIEVKKKVEDIIGLLSHDQKLVYQARILEDEKTVHFYRISENSVVNVIDRFRCGMQIYAKLIDGRRLELEITKIENISDVKKKIQNKLGITNELILMYQGEILDNEETVEFYRIAEKTFIIGILRETILINAKLISGDSIQLLTTNSDRIIDIKRKIQEKTHIHIFEQSLSYKDIVLSNRMTVGDCHLVTNSIIKVSQRDFQIKKRGICLIISIENFINNQPCRCGNKEEERRITDTFEPLGFTIKVYRNIECNTMAHVISQTKEDIRGTDTMFLMFVLSRGDNRSFFTLDGRRCSYENIFSPFSNDNLSKLAGKPKLFFIVCNPWMGDNKEDGHVAALNQGHSGLESCPDKGDSVTTKADMFIGHSCGELYQSRCDNDHGSYYVRCLCNVVTKHPEWSVVNVHQEVQRRLSIKSFTNDGLQMPFCTNNLTSHAFFIEDCF